MGRRHCNTIVDFRMEGYERLSAPEETLREGYELLCQKGDSQKRLIKTSIQK
jgi:hypothetical protein